MLIIYFDLLPFYAILRSIPNKLLGVIAMFSALLVPLLLPILDVSKSKGIQFRPLSKIAFYVFVANFLILMQLGAKHVESPFIEFGQISTALYFAHFLVIVPSISLLENSLMDIATNSYSPSYKLFYYGIPWDETL
jgi:ubiquinol-cytochrome c reductase cytochrome b subunit